MTTKVAEFVENNITFPPERKRKQQMFGGEFTFKIDVLRQHPDLLAEVMALSEKHDALEADHNKRSIASLEAECDAMIEGAQKAAKVFKELEDEYFVEQKRYSKAKDYLDSANEEYRQVQAGAEQQEGLLTRAQKAERQKAVDRYEERYYKAAAAESVALTVLNQRIRRKNDAANAAVAWEAEARRIQSELDALLPSNQEEDISSLRFS